MKRFLALCTLALCTFARSALAQDDGREPEPLEAPPPDAPPPPKKKIQKPEFEIGGGPGVARLWGVDVLKAHLEVGGRLVRVAEAGPYLTLHAVIEPGWTSEGLGVHRGVLATGFELPLGDFGLWAGGSAQLGYLVFDRRSETKLLDVVGWPDLGVNARLGFDFARFDGGGALLVFTRGDADWFPGRTTTLGAAAGIGLRL